MDSVYEGFMKAKRRASQAVAFAVSLGGFCNQTKILAVEDGPVTVDASEIVGPEEIPHVRHQGSRERERNEKRARRAFYGGKQWPAGVVETGKPFKVNMIQPSVDETLTKRSQVCTGGYQCGGDACDVCLHPVVAP